MYERYAQEMDKFGIDGWEIFQVDRDIKNYQNNGDLVILRMRREKVV